MLSARGVVAGYARGRAVLDGVDVTVPRGAVRGLAGPSGCGKSTLARVLALLQRPWSGTVELDGREIRGARYSVPRESRTSVGIVFQQPRPAVDPRMTLREIVSEPLRVRGARQPRARVDELAETTGLDAELLGRMPHEVSDGQLQRACLARAMAPRPRYLICDEMTGMLDASTTAALVRVVTGRVAEEGTGVLAISHDESLLRAWAGDDVIRW
ncbi:peptide/nickel transport system ATP-binding protein [Actinopolyspora lacussalsi subsp. righensis]|uniref:Peptide/nickel transport system ATP-binding protein n=2 Tax=Actinopolyspora alba group TaxID=2893675 RepID=A0A1I1V6T1_9ACTN|nr:ATP-binding cassette domain-containing protein [Actinopolyspora righensis]SFD78751.1 peptide/nickel transport system ATP-binding protein [Actinopolyspora alba]SFT66446.1 peptide/nickel transport system ATP-binding protein [Actinopolyspora righensis]